MLGFIVDRSTRAAVRVMRGTTRRHFVVRIVVGCVLGAATVATVAPYAGAHAAATNSSITPSACSTINVHVDGWDYNNFGGFGNRGYIYVNSSSVFQNLHDAIFRNFFITGDADNYVEGGWFANPAAGYTYPTVYAEWKINGIDSNPQPYHGYILQLGAARVFNVENVGNIGIFRFYVDDQTDPYNYSPTMNFQNGYIQTNSERYNSCDSMFADFYELNYYNSNNWTSSYGNLECFIANAGDYFFNKVSNSENTVKTSGISC